MPLSAWISELGHGLLHLVYPGLCHLCGQSLPTGTTAFCQSCRSRLIADTRPTCPRCASTIGPFSNTENGCPSCRAESFAFESVIRLGPYDGLLRDTVLQLKRHTGEVVAELLGELWAEQCRNQFAAVKPDCIVPIPLHWWRRWRRGYNQSAAIAHGLGTILGIPCHRSWLRRVRNTPAQHLMSPTARRENMRGAFRASWRTQVQKATVLLVDDVMTTGSTVHEAAAALKRVGAARVVVAVVCRAGS